LTPGCEERNDERAKLSIQAYHKLGDHELSEVSETLFIPLFFRAVESKEQDPIVRDERAPALLERISYDFSHCENLALDRVFTLMRSREFDRCARAFLAEHPSSVVVEIGCGLDDRLSRVDNEKVDWYNLDLPEVIALRTKLLGEEKRCKSIACSILDPSWLEQVRARPGDPCLFLAEGVLVYFDESKARRIVLTLRDRYPGSKLVFDTLSPFMVWMKRLEPGTKDAAMLVRWALRSDRELERWGEGLRLLGSWNYFSQREPRLGWASLLRFFPPIARGARILRYRLGRPS
jgi:O-methyltransferase involved in polyketide biosynthesis